MSTAADDVRERALGRLAVLERVAFVALLFLVAFPRATALTDPFDRSPAGARAARHAIAVTNEVREAGLELPGQFDGRLEGLERSLRKIGE